MMQSQLGLCTTKKMIFYNTSSKKVPKNHLRRLGNDIFVNNRRCTKTVFEKSS